MRIREQLCGDTLNLFGKEDHRFQWLRYYWYYSSLPFPERNENRLWASGTALSVCVPEVFYYREIVSWCADKFDQSQRVIQLQGQSPVPFISISFQNNVEASRANNHIQRRQGQTFLEGEIQWNKMLAGIS